MVDEAHHLHWSEEKVSPEYDCIEQLSAQSRKAYYYSQQHQNKWVFKAILHGFASWILLVFMI